MPDDGQNEQGTRVAAAVSRRGFIAAAVAGGVVAGCGGGHDRRGPAVRAAAPGGQAQPTLHGAHQAGIATPAQGHLLLAAFDLQRDEPDALRDLLVAWSDAAGRLMDGRSVGGVVPDTGEADGLPTAGLTITIGLGPTLFERNGRDRLGLARVRPAALATLPAFRGDALEARRSGGDLCAQVCADDVQVAFHAVHALTRVAAGVATPRWTQQGFRPSPRGGTPRNVLGFRDGTNNVRSDDAAGMARHVWVGGGEDPAWMRGGTYLVARRIRTLLDVWDRTSVEAQEAAIGRHKGSGAPLGGRRENDRLDLSPDSRIPANAHVRLAAPASNGGTAILRRAYNYTGEIDTHTAQLDAGLIFLCFQRDPRHQFVPLQTRLSKSDALSKHLLHTGSALFACPPAAKAGGFIGQGLFETA